MTQTILNYREMEKELSLYKAAVRKAALIMKNNVALYKYADVDTIVKNLLDDVSNCPPNGLC